MSVLPSTSPEYSPCLLSKRGARAEAPPSRVLTIMRQVAYEHGTTAERLIGPDLRRKVSDARKEAMRAVRMMDWAGGSPSFPLIGRWFGGRDHSTVIHACAGLATEEQMTLELAA